MLLSVATAHVDTSESAELIVIRVNIGRLEPVNTESAIMAMKEYWIKYLNDITLNYEV